MGSVIVNLVALVVLPFFLLGLVVRTKSLWSGRRGAPLWQPLFDVVRLFRKTSVYSTTTTPVFRIGPWVYWLTAVGAALVVPLAGGGPLVSFSFDFVWLAYAWGLGRVALMLAALDTGSSFEGMGTAREATFATLVEPAFFLVAGALGLVAHTQELHEALRLAPDAGGGSAIVWATAVVALFIVLQVETARMPIDDPTTHLELTMVHEVMVLDHSGPDLGAIQAGTAVKFFVATSMLAVLLNPWAGDATVGALLVHVALCCAVAVIVGTVESLIARLRLNAVPQYVAMALASGIAGLLATAWRAGGIP